jgi:hypothetical protein
MAAVTVKDVPAHDLIVTYAALLKRQGKVSVLAGQSTQGSCTDQLVKFPSDGCAFMGGSCQDQHS